jgi:hypothetical protein
MSHFGLAGICVEGLPAQRIQCEATLERQGALNDIRALGCVMHEMLTGRTLSPLQRERAELPAIASPALPRELDVIVRKAASTDLATRYQAAATLCAELRALAAILEVRAAMGSDAARVPAHRAS